MEVRLQWCKSCTEAWIVREVFAGKGRKDKTREVKPWVFVYREDGVGNKNCMQFCILLDLITLQTGGNV